MFARLKDFFRRAPEGDIFDAVERNNVEDVRYWIRHGVDVYACCSDSERPLLKLVLQPINPMFSAPDKGFATEEGRLAFLAPYIVNHKAHVAATLEAQTTIMQELLSADTHGKSSLYYFLDLLLDNRIKEADHCRHFVIDAFKNFVAHTDKVNLSGIHFIYNILKIYGDVVHLNISALGEYFIECQNHGIRLSNPDLPCMFNVPVESLIDLSQQNIDTRKFKNHPSIWGITALHLLCATSHVNEGVLDLFINAGIDVNAIDYLGRTPLHYWMKYSYKIVHYDMWPFPNTKALLESEKYKWDVAKYLIDHGTNYEVQDCNGKTALMDLTNLELFEIAARGREVSLLYKLVAGGVDIDLNTRAHHTFLKNAIALCNKETASIIKKSVICDKLLSSFDTKQEDVRLLLEEITAEEKSVLKARIATKCQSLTQAKAPDKFEKYLPSIINGICSIFDADCPDGILNLKFLKAKNVIKILHSGTLQQAIEGAADYAMIETIPITSDLGASAAQGFQEDIRSSLLLGTAHTPDFLALE